MIDQKISKLNSWFEEKIALCGKRNQELNGDGRTDEAISEKIKANIYDVFRTVLSVAVKTGKEDADAVKTFFVQRAEQIPAGWAVALEKAREHNDTVRMQTEQIKLDTVQEIREKFSKIWEGAE
ncbi:MAG: hypothetical protein ILP14_11535 [Oscillospiraceae bacterium]|nr:hypothetical protein [Oscillospiraceae bacterium]